MSATYLLERRSTQYSLMALVAVVAAGCGADVAWRKAGDPVVEPVAARTIAGDVLHGRAAHAPVAVERVTNALCSAGRSQTVKGELLSAGPRFGLVWVTGDLETALAYYYDTTPPITAWGWQFEYQFEAVEDGPTGLVEFVPMITGLDYGEALFSMSAFAGIRLPQGTEFVVGPYYSAASDSVGLGVAVGHTFKTGNLNVPVNLSVTRNNNGDRIAFTLGFNLRQ